MRIKTLSLSIVCILTLSHFDVRAEQIHTIPKAQDSVFVQSQSDLTTTHVGASLADDAVNNDEWLLTVVPSVIAVITRKTYTLTVSKAGSGTVSVRRQNLLDS